MKPFIDMMQSGQVWNAVDAEPPAKGAPLAPLLAGARARGVADGFEWLGLAAILLDDRGEVLHVNPRAVDLMGEDFVFFLRAPEGARCRDRRRARRCDLSRLGRRDLLPPRDPFEVGPRHGGRANRGEDSLDDDPFQLLRAVAILEWDEEPVVQARRATPLNRGARRR